MKFNIYQKKNIILIDIFIAGICLLGINHVISKAGLNPSSHVSFNESKNHLVFQAIYAPELLNIFSIGDTLISVNGSPYTKKSDLEFLFDNHVIGDTVRVSYIHNNISTQIRLPLPAYYDLEYVILQLISGFFFMIIALFVVLKRPEAADSRAFHWACFGAAVIITCTWGQITKPLFSLPNISRIFFMLAYSFEPTFFLHLSLVFPKTKWSSQNKYLKVLYIFSIVLFIYQIAAFTAAINPVSLEMFRLFMIGFDINRVFFASVIGTGLIFFFHSFATAREEMDRRKLLWILLGLILGPFVYVSLWQVPQLMGYDSIMPEEVLVMIIIVTPLTFSISIVRYNLFDIDYIINRSTVYVFVATLLLIIYSSIVLIAALLLGGVSIKSSLIGASITTILIPLIFDPVRRRIQGYIDRKFFRVSYNYRLAQTRISKEMDKFIRIKDLAVYVLQEIDELLHVTRCGFYYRDKQRDSWRLIASRNYRPSSSRTIIDLSHKLNIIGHSFVGRPDKVESSARIKDITKFGKKPRGMSLIRSIYSADGSLFAIMFFGSKKSGSQFSLEDIDILNSIGSQIGLTMDRINLQKDLILQNEETRRLKELNKQISVFVASVGHELKTPLTSIRMYAGFLEKEQQTTPENNNYLWTIKGESERLERLINNVLNISKIERGVMHYNIVEIDISAILHKSIALMEYQLKQNEFELDSRIPDEPVWIQGDADALIEVFSNLISNAIKYSRLEKYLFIKLTRTKKEVNIFVEDHGIGISDEDKNQIFDAFYRSTREDVLTIPGTGLGLAMVKHIIDAHNGYIDLKSKLGKGTTFKVSFNCVLENA